MRFSNGRVGQSHSDIENAIEKSVHISAHLANHFARISAQNRPARSVAQDFMNVLQKVRFLAGTGTAIANDFPSAGSPLDLKVTAREAGRCFGRATWRKS
jgi:hypothetical protein